MYKFVAPLIVCLIISISCVNAKNNQEYVIERDISYVSPLEKNAYRTERCRLDIYYGKGGKNMPVLVWFHGGGLEAGEKYIPDELKGQGIIVVAPNYRLSPQATHPAYLEDAAQAVAWVISHISRYGGSTQDVYVGGHSAGGYLTLMLGLDKRYLAKHGVDADTIKGLMPISGQTNTHNTIRKERGLPVDVPIVDGYAPLNHARPGIAPILLTTGARELELPARYEENAHLLAILKLMGNQDVVLHELSGFDHGTVCVPSYFLMREWIKKHSGR